MDAWLAAATGRRADQHDFVLGALGNRLARNGPPAPECAPAPDEARALLSECLSDARLRDPARPPAWCTALDDFLQALPADDSELRSLGHPGSPEVDQWRPDPQSDPLAGLWDGALGAALSLCPDMPGTALSLSEAARTDLAVSLVGRILAAITRALDPELQAARALGLTGGFAIPGDRQAWLDRLADLPGLAYPLGLAIDNWRRGAHEMLVRIAEDLPAITAHLLSGPMPHTVVRFAPDAGDPHEGGRSVCIVRFDGGRRVVYKPKPQEGPAAWQSLLAALARSPALHSGGVELDIRPVLVRDGYGWDAMVAVDSVSSADVRGTCRWLASYGALCRVLELLEASDMWFDNLITSGGLPQFIDVETLLQPKPPGMNDAQRLLCETIAPTGAVSMPLPLPDGAVEDIGGLRPVGVVRLPFTESVMGQLSSKVEGYDQAGVMQWTPPRWRPDFAPGVNAEDELLRGYRAVGGALAEPETRAAVEELFGQLAAAPARVVLRSTFVCYVILRESLSCEVLTSGWRREVALASLLAPAAAAHAREESLAGGDSGRPSDSRLTLADQLLLVGAADAAVMRDLDIPLVRHDPAGEGVRLDGTTVHEGWFEGVPLQRALARLVDSPWEAAREEVLVAVARRALAAGTPEAGAARAEARERMVEALGSCGVARQRAVAAVDAISA